MDVLISLNQLICFAWQTVMFSMTSSRSLRCCRFAFPILIPCRQPLTLLQLITNVSSDTNRLLRVFSLCVGTLINLACKPDVMGQNKLVQFPTLHEEFIQLSSLRQLE